MNEIKGVILAAGKGKRLGASNPKPLSKILGKKSILDFQIEQLAEKIGRKNIMIVVGYKKEKIRERYPDLNYLYNEQFDQTNSCKSLLLAMRKINNDMITINADVYFDKGVLDLIIPSEESSSLVNQKECGDEEMKYDLDSDGNINRLSKSLKKYKGEVFGIHFFKKKNLPNIINELEKIDKKYFAAKAYDNLLKQGRLVLKPKYVEPFFCMDVDIEDDLNLVRNHLNGSIKS